MKEYYRFTGRQLPKTWSDYDYDFQFNLKKAKEKKEKEKKEKDEIDKILEDAIIKNNTEDPPPIPGPE